jgi:hypothetical protein
MTFTATRWPVVMSTAETTWPKEPCQHTNVDPHATLAKPHGQSHLPWAHSRLHKTMGTAKMGELVAAQGKYCALGGGVGKVDGLGGGGALMRRKKKRMDHHAPCPSSLPPCTSCPACPQSSLGNHRHWMRQGEEASGCTPHGVASGRQGFTHGKKWAATRFQRISISKTKTKSNTWGGGGCDKCTYALPDASASFWAWRSLFLR